jgi:hypothetical protein
VSRSHEVKLVAIAALGALGCGHLIGADEITFDERPECAVQADCNKFDSFDPHVCVEGSCVALRNDGEEGGECRIVLGQGALDDSAPPFVFGILSDDGAVGDELSPAGTLFEFARQEFERKGGVTIGGRTHAPVAVVCDAFQEPQESVDRTLDHLFEKLRVPGVVSTLYANELKETFEHVHQDMGHSALFVSAFESDSQLASVDDDGELWHMLGPPVTVAEAYPPLVQRAENYVNPPSADGTRPPIRLALVNDTGSLTSDMANAVEQKLRLNGLGATENGPEYYRRFALATADDYASTLEALIDFQPHIVVPVTDDEFLSQILFPLEYGWPASSEQPRPFYVMSPFHVDDVQLLELLTYAIPEARTRLAGVSLASDHESAVYQTFQRNVNAAFQDPGLQNQENFYDAMYFFLYAAAAGNSAHPTGQNLARGMRRLVQGEPYQMGQEQIPAVLAKLNESPSTSIALEGTLGPPDFDVTTGTRLYTPSSAFCVADEDGVLVYRHDVLRYDQKRGVLTGDFDCFAGFPAE